MVNLLLFALLFLTSLYLSFAFEVNDPNPIQLLTSDKHYGPDGPWQAVTVWLGTQQTQVDLYPGGSYGSIILSETICVGFTAYPCGSGGLYNSSGSKAFDDHSIQIFEWGDQGWVLGALKYYVNRKYSMDQLYISPNGVYVSNLSILLVEDVSMIYPDGSYYPIQLGSLALGGAFPNQTFHIPDRADINASLLPGFLLEQNRISSSSFGMHLGSATLGPPLSLWLGGYDRSRIVGPVSIQVIKDLGPTIDLLDIGIGVDHGASPFPFVSREGFLAEGNLSIGQSIPLVMNPSAPYLAVPSSTCAAIAKSLPVTYNPKYGLYFWNVNDRLYNRIVRSPSYLSFIFRAQGLDCQHYNQSSVRAPQSNARCTIGRNSYPVLSMPTSSRLGSRLGWMVPWSSFFTSCILWYKLERWAREMVFGTSCRSQHGLDFQPIAFVARLNSCRIKLGRHMERFMVWTLVPVTG